MSLMNIFLINFHMYYLYLFIHINRNFHLEIYSKPLSVIGASGVLRYNGFIFIFSGLIRGNRELLGYSLLIVFLYGSMVWGMFPFSVAENVSWEGHLMGFIVGFFLSIFSRRISYKRVYSWEVEENNVMIMIKMMIIMKRTFLLSIGIKRLIRNLSSISYTGKFEKKITKFMGWHLAI